MADRDGVEYQREYYLRNRDKIVEQRQEHYQANKDEILERGKKYRQANKDKAAERYQRNRDERIAYSREYKQRNKDKIAEYNQQNRDKLAERSREYRQQNKEKVAECRRRYYYKNKDRIAKYMREHRQKNIQARLAATLRSRLTKTLRGKNKAASTMALIGCTMNELKQYIESQFTEGMSWENYGYYGWHLDHIVPVIVFDLTDPEQQKLCFHYTNLQPLWAEDNHAKHGKLPHEWKEVAQ